MDGELTPEQLEAIVAGKVNVPPRRPQGTTAAVATVHACATCGKKGGGCGH